MPVVNKVRWAIRPERCALLIHDMQPHYLAALPEAERQRVVAATRALAGAALRAGVPIFASAVPPQHGRERGLMLDLWGAGPSAQSDELDLGLGLEDAPVRRIVKRSYSAFYGNDFELLLRRLDRDALLVAGVYTSIGCLCTATDAFMRDIRPFLVADALADLTPEDHAAGLRQAARTCARIVDSEEVGRALAHRPEEGRYAREAIDVC